MPSWLRGVPIFGVFLRYLNLYVGRGDLQYFKKVAPRDLWLDRLVVPVSLNVLFVFVVWWFWQDGVENIDASGLVNSVFPSLLGFGIGVFALIFVLPEDLMGALDRRKAKSGLGSSMMISDMAYPLVYLAFGVVASAVVELLLSSPVSDFVNLFIFMYGLTLVFDLIGVIAAAAIAGRGKSQNNLGPSERDRLLTRLRRSPGRHDK